LDGPDVEAVFLSCTAMPSLEVIEAIEARLGKPAVGSNQATLWAMRALAGLPAGPLGVGRLLSLPGPDADTWR
ncbi:MAG: arylmalonate decarboxylase, partial [Sedimentitalea sp.]|nr:arylmalonate decarboxylase [Sedimentitalea sp.]